MARVEQSSERSASRRTKAAAGRTPTRRAAQPRAAPEGASAEGQGSHLARLIREAGLNNNKLAERAGVRRETISRVVNGHVGLGPSLARRLAPPLGVTVDELVVPREAEVEPRRSPELRLRELEEDRDYLLQVVRELLAHLEKMGVGAPPIPSPPRSGAFVRAPGRTAQDGADAVDVAAGQRRPRMRRHR